MRLLGKSALITAAARGNGLAFSRAVGVDRAHVVLTSLDLIRHGVNVNAIFLASDEARCIVAQTCDVDGGQWTT